MEWNVELLVYSKTRAKVALLEITQFSSVFLGSLLRKVSWEWDEYDDIQRKVTAKALMNDKDPLLLAVKVSGYTKLPAPGQVRRR